MSLPRGGGKSFNSTNNNPSPKEKNVSEVRSPNVEQLSQSVAQVSLDSAQDDGQWEVYAKKSKNRAGSSAAKQWGAQNSNPKWGHSYVVQKSSKHNNGGQGRASVKTWQMQASDSRTHGGRGTARGASRGSDNNYVAPQPVICSPLEHGWNWASRAGPNQSKGSVHGQGKEENVSNSHLSDENEDKDKDLEADDDSEVLDDTDDDLLSEGSDSDASQKSHDTRKKSSWFKKFFEIFDSLTIEEITEPARQWHCPACQGGPGAIDWYRGLQPLVTHAKTKRSKRVKLHRELAGLLNEELRKRGTSVVPAGEAFGKWKGLKDEDKDHDIVWPPMIIVMNTKLEQDENEKWLGMGNQELLDYFSSYAAEKARHSYGPKGHRGMSILIFEASARGYLEAERLHKHFVEQGTDRNAWNRASNLRQVLFASGGNRQLYAYMAEKGDLDSFNRHSQGKSRLKYEMKSYQQMVVNQIRQMSEDNQQLIYLKNKVVKEQRNAKVLKESLGKVCAKLEKTREENRIVRQRTQMQHEENQEEMDLQEQFFKDQIKILHESRDAKEESFERLQQEEREKVKQSNANPSNTEENGRRLEEIETFIKSQDREMEDFVAERDQLIKLYEGKKAAMRRRHWEEEVEHEKELDNELTRLMEKYSPHRPTDAANAFDG